MYVGVGAQSRAVLKRPRDPKPALMRQNKRHAQGRARRGDFADVARRGADRLKISAEWVGSGDFIDCLKIFLPVHDKKVILRKLQRKIEAAASSGKSVFSLENMTFFFRYIPGRGRGGRILQICSKPLTPAEIEKIEARGSSSLEASLRAQEAQGSGTKDTELKGEGAKSDPQSEPKELKAQGLERLRAGHSAASGEQPRQTPVKPSCAPSAENSSIPSSVSNAFLFASKKHQERAIFKWNVLREWERAKGLGSKEGAKGLKEQAFLEYIHAKTGVKVSAGKLYAWQRLYKEGGMDALIDTRGRKKGEGNSIKALGLESLCEKLILSQRGRINISNIHRALNFHILTGATEREKVLNHGGKAQRSLKPLPTLKEFLGKKDEVISYQYFKQDNKCPSRPQKSRKRILLRLNFLVL